MPRKPLFLVLALALAAPATAGRKKGAADPDIDDVGAQLLGRSLVTDGAWEKLVELCDDIGHRLSGSPQLEAAVTWSAAKMAADGLDVHTEEVMVPTWIRGAERLLLLGDVDHELDVLALGGSIGTPEGGLEGEVLVVDGWEHLESLGEAVKGKIVLFDVPFTTYGDTVQFRVRCANEASKLGAVAALVRSVGPVSLDTPHTGTMAAYEEGVEKIPAAAVPVETAARFRRMQERAIPIRIRLELGARSEPDSLSHNVVGEIRGREKPEEVVVLGCHLDSWDVGQGAQDDGAGCVSAMEAGKLIAELPVAPRRTVRVVLFTNEENGLAGGRAYAEAHADERIVAAMEMDTGAGQPFGWRVDVRREDEAEQARLLERALGALSPVRRTLANIGADDLEPSWSGADIGPLVAGGVLGLGLKQDTTGYWPIHHTEADTVDKIDPALLQRNVAAMAVTAWYLAEMQETPLP